MDKQKAQQAIEAIISKHHSQIGYRNARRQSAPAKKDIKQLEALGILDIMPRGFGYSDTKEVLSAAIDAGGQRITEGGWTLYGDADYVTYTTKPSGLYLAINEKPSLVNWLASFNWKTGRAS